MKKGDWVVTEDGHIGYVTMYTFMTDYSLVQFKGSPVASMQRKDSLTKLDPAVGDILNAVNTNERK